MKKLSILTAFALLVGGQALAQAKADQPQAATKNNKLVIYQLLPRYFSNTNTNNKIHGSKEENGVGKFNDINPKALSAIKQLGATHVWYTGVIEHATMTDYSAYGIKQDDPDVVKGRAGSPYAIKDYYDVDPDLAVDVKNRMAEFEALVKRTHEMGLKVMIDFIPNHVARTYQSDAKPAGVIDFGEQDDKTLAYSPKNDYYYLPGKTMVVPAGVNPGGAAFTHPLKDGKFDETPAKVTGNNIFNEKPGVDDWYETIKLNYGRDLQNNKEYLDPIPQVWLKMRDILRFWVSKDVDGFRCDVAEFVPVEFWNWVISDLKAINPSLIFMAESYDPKLYKQYVTQGKFDYLYDKVGLYDSLKKLIKNEPGANVKEISTVLQSQGPELWPHMLRFLENHDEERIASKGFARDPKLALPAMVLTATLATGPTMVYYGQESGEQADGVEGFGGEDNRSTLFDYWGLPQHQQWVNGGKYDGGQLTASQKELRAFYQHLLQFSKTNAAITNGQFKEIQLPGLNEKQYAYLRYAGKERVLVIANFDRNQPVDTHFVLSQELISILGGSIKTNKLKDLLSGKSIGKNAISDGFKVKVLPTHAAIISF